MIEYIAACLIVVACSAAYSASDSRHIRQFSVGLSFVVLAGFLGLRYSYGNDYWSYFELFAEAPELIDSPDNNVELGWLWLNVLLQPIGFRGLLIVTALFYLLVLFWLIFREVPRRYIWVSFFLLLVEPSNFLIHLSAMRQSVAIVIFVIAVLALANKQIIAYLVFVAIASAFHRSVLVMAPFFIIAAPELSNRFSRSMSGSRWFLFYLAAYAAGAWALIEYGPELMNSLKSSVSRYESYSDKASVGSGLGVGIHFVFFVLFTYYGLLQRGRERIILYMCAATYVFVPLVFVNSLASRLLMYPQMAMILGVPFILKRERRTVIRLGIVTLFVLWTGVAFTVFWNSPTYAPYFSDYQRAL